MKLLFGAAVMSGCLATLQSEAGGFPFFQPLAPPRSLQVMAHRGAAAQAPENTRPALERCIEDGLEWVEVDVRLTKDGQFILAHDAEIVVPPNGVWRLKEHTWGELSQLEVGSTFGPRHGGTRLLSLTECFELARGRINLYLDCKDVDPAQLAREIIAARMENQVVVYDTLVNLQRISASAGGRLATMAKWHPGMEIASWVQTNSLAAVEINADEITPDVVKAFHGLGIKVETKNLDAWDRPDYWDQAMDAGADWIQTDLPEEVLARALSRLPGTRPVRISCHRGASRYAPENTVPAFEKAIRLGVDFVEFDVRTTSDGKLFLLHDGQLDRTTDGKGPISATPSSVVTGLSAGSHFGSRFAGMRVPSLDEFFDAVAGKVGLYLDAKAIAPEALAEVLQRHNAVSRAVVYQHPDFLLRLKEINPEIRAMPPLGSLQELPGLIARLKPYAVDARWSTLSKELIEQCHKAGILVFSDALGSHERVEDYLQAIRWGIDVIQTDHPLRVMRAIELASRKP